MIHDVKEITLSDVLVVEIWLAYPYPKYWFIRICGSCALLPNTIPLQDNLAVGHWKLAGLLSHRSILQI